MTPPPDKPEFFLGGADLEMVVIRELLDRHAPGRVHDADLSWGAKASAYRGRLLDLLARGGTAVLVELDDLGLAAGPHAERVVVADHHGHRAGADVPTALEHIFTLLGLPTADWTRDFALVAANDRGHIPALVRAGATPDEIRAVRARDRRAQGITPAEEEAGRVAAAAAETHLGGRLTVVRLSHTRAATVTDVLAPELGGPGFENLLLLAPGQPMFFGSGRGINALRAAHPDGWYGGELPARGYWGVGRTIAPTDLLTLLESPLMSAPRPAAMIPVKVYHHTLLWPVLMRGPGGDDADTERKIEEFVGAFSKAGWHEQVGKDDGVHRDFTYAEVVYFHPFVRDFLFGDGHTKTEQRAVRRFKRSDVTKLTVGIAPPPTSGDAAFELTLKVERAELLLLRPRVAILMIEVSNRDPARTFDPTNEPTLADARTPLSLQQALYLQSRLRHIYPPYFDGATHGDCPSKVEWHGLHPPSAGPADPADPVLTAASGHPEFDTFTRVGAEPPVYDHWRRWFGEKVKPLQSAADKEAAGRLSLQQLLDDRMPGLSFLAVDDPTVIDPADLDRLPAFDPPGLDYDPDFSAPLRDGFRYTRFRHLGTTYFGNGTSFAALCNTGPLTDTLLGHFRRHYTHLAVLAHFQHAALLYFADELADTAKMLADRKHEAEYADRHWRTRIRAIQHRFLKFRTRSYFTEVSNQVQGKDLFAFWLRHLGTAALFDRVAATNSQVYEALENFETRQLSEAQAKENEEMKGLAVSQTRLARVAQVGLTISIVLAAFSAVFAWLALYPEENRREPGIWTWPPYWGPLLWLALGAAVAGLSYALLRQQLRKEGNPAPPPANHP